MNDSKSVQALRPLALIVCGLTLVASSLLISAAQVGSSLRSGYGVNQDAVVSTMAAVQK